MSFSSTADTRTNALPLLIVKLQRELDVAGSLGVSNLAKIRSQCCLWRIVISHMIPQYSRPATIPRCKILSLFSSTLIYRWLSDRMAP